MASGTGDAPRRATAELHSVPRTGSRRRPRSTAAHGSRSDERPRIPPSRRPVHRAAGEIQFGAVSGGAIVTGVSEVEVQALTRLDGSLTLRSSYRMAGELGVATTRWRALLEVVDRIGVLDWRPAADDRADEPLALPPPTVVLPGRGALVRDVAALLRRDGIDAIVTPSEPHPELPPEVPPEFPPGGGARPPAVRPALAVLIGPTALDPRSGDEWLRRGVPHLPVVAEESFATVGPLVEPALSGPCLWCLDLHRSDRDPAWPTVLAQLCGSAGDIVRRETSSDTDPALAHLVAGCIDLLTRRLLGHEPVPTGVAVELSLPWPRMDHRRWTIHPRCRRRHRSPGRGVA